MALGRNTGLYGVTSGMARDVLDPKFKPLLTRWSKRVFPQQPQLNDLTGRELHVRAGQPGIPYAPLVSPEIADQHHVLFLHATTHNQPFAVS